MADYNINAVTRRVVFTGSAGLGPYAFTFEILDDDDLAVYFNTTKLTKTTDYTVTINANGTGSVSVIVNVGGNIPATPDANDTIIILGARDIERVTDFVTAGDLLASSLNQQLDSLTIFDQQVAEEQKRSLQAPVFDPAHVDDGGTLDMTLPAKDTRKGKYLAFNSTTGNPEAGASSDDVATLADITDDIATLADIEDGTDATDAIQTVAGISANVTTVAGVSANVTTVAGISANVTTVAGDSADIQAVAADAADIGTVASNISDVNTAATNITDIQNASTNAATATTKAAEAATSATNAATSATNASTSATNAATSATAAAASQTAAAASAASAASAFDNFDDTYLGSKTSNPTVDNDGDPLTQGDLYFNSTANEMRVYDGANWIAATSAGGVSLILYEYTATAGQTTFSGSDDNSATLSYTADNLQVVMNGIVLDPSDFTATNGTSVVLASGAALNDIVNIYAFKSFTTADMVSASAGGTFSGNVTISADATVTGDLTVDTNTLHVDAANNKVGIGNSSPAQLLSVGGTSSGTKVIQVTNSTAGTAFNDGMQMFINDSAGGLNMRENYPLQIYVNGAERGRFLAGGGLTFNGDTAAANALDDYEEGSWTPSIGGNATYDVQSGVYTKIGRMVYVWFYLAINTKGTGSGNIISGLPYAPGTSNQFGGVAYYNGINTNTYEFHLNFRSDSTIRSELKTSFGTGQQSGGTWTKDDAVCIASGWYYT